ncbi:MAG TPA: cystathionine beta-lyase [Bacteroidales bacterium]|nr:MAG: cystathionine beta-lyase [Bacteroidetes bacterium GWE2_42_24]OFY29480.1 MAG: cystathionine beta-lyase [Bacteroidetes bacterium GWF2_43_11]PKP27800.1 MAG: cystathionine beta-lyase [Bacteroidetes bacterium HGW-Bacteroidetes-22]HAQ64679.1 cystathionine beta-lyase [Bacteroidales bacterium]HBZ67274.1 cystathionine beta-lyase [Bacteroidales bacterium]
MKFDAVSNVFDLLQFGEFGDVNPSITDSATYTFMQAKTMTETFEGTAEGCFLYSRHWNPSNKFLADALAAMEGTESAWVTGSGMGAITCTILQICKAGDHIVSSRTIYGGTFAFMQNWLPKYNIGVTFVDPTNLDEVTAAIRPNTKMIYTETMTNPLLQISDIPALASIANNHGIKLVVDNTFTPLMVAPAQLGAHIVVYSLTKFINGKNDCVGGAICAPVEFINALSNVNDGTAMLIGPVLDPLRSSSILKNLHTLHIRMQKHSQNAMYLAERFRENQLPFLYPGMPDHPGHQVLRKMMNPDFGFGGMIAIDMKTAENASAFMEMMEKQGVGYLAVSLGYFKTLFSNSGKSTSSEVPAEEQQKMGLSAGLVRFSMGLDHDIERTWQKIKFCLAELKII